MQPHVGGCDSNSHLPVFDPVAFAHLQLGQMISQLVTGKRCVSCLVKQSFSLCEHTPRPLALQGTSRGGQFRRGSEVLQKAALAA